MSVVVFLVGPVNVPYSLPPLRAKKMLVHELTYTFLARKRCLLEQEGVRLGQLPVNLQVRRWRDCARTLGRCGGLAWSHRWSCRAVMMVMAPAAKGTVARARGGLHQEGGLGGWVGGWVD